MDLRNTQIKDTYGNILTTGSVAGAPTIGTLQNGQGTNVTALTLDGDLTVDNVNATVLTGTLSTAAQTSVTSVGTLTGLSVNGTTALQGAVTINDAGADVDFRVKGDTDENLLFVDASTDRVGIGTNTPASLLDVDGDLTIADKIIHAGDTNTAIRFPSADTVTVETSGSERLRIDSNGGLIGKAAAGGHTIFNEDGVDADFRVEGVGDANLLYVDASTARVGIGTNAPTSVLTVNGVASFGAGAVGTPSIARSNDLNTGLYFPAADTIAISTAGAEAMRVNSTGVVLVGASSFTRNQSSGNGTLYVDDSIMSADGDIKKYFSRGTAGASTGTCVWKFKLRTPTAVSTALVKLSVSTRYATNTTTESGVAVYYFQLHETTAGVITQNGLSAIFEYGLTYATDFAFADLTGGECTITFTNTKGAGRIMNSTVEILSPVGLIYLDSITYT